MDNRFWSIIKNDERVKLIFAYLIIPIINVYASMNTYASLSNLVRYVVIFSFVDMLLIVLLPTIIRFIFKRDGLKNGREITFYLTLSASMLILLYYILHSNFIIPSVTELLAPYLILSYKCRCENGKLPSTFLIAVFITVIIFMLNIMSINSTTIRSTVIATTLGFIPFELIRLIMSRKKANQPPFTDTQNTPAINLVNIGLACIGRKSKHTNPCLTPEHERARHEVEYTFLRQLADKYTDVEVRKVLAKHFMLYKETCLYIIYSVLLKGDTKLHGTVKTKLTECLIDGLTLDAKVQRKKYMYLFSKAFYDEYMRSHKLERTLSYTFWSVLAEKHPDLAPTKDLPSLMQVSGLDAIYRYEYETVKNTNF